MQPPQPSFSRLWTTITPRLSTWRPLSQNIRQVRCLHEAVAPSLQRRQLYGPNPIFRTTRLAALHRVQRRYESSKPLTNSSTSSPSTTPGALNPDVPTYQMTFTCKACNTRSSHKISKQGYYHGTILITCPGCKARHLIADHLKIFSDKSVTLEDIMKEKGDLVRRATLAEGTEGQEDVDRVGDVEFWGKEAEQWRDEKGPEVKVGGPRVRLGKLGADGNITRD